MLDLIVLALILAAFFAALIDTALGMCYGTILTPILLIAGYPPEIMVPTVLLSQLIVDIGGSTTHTKIKNFTKKDRKIALLVAIPSTILVSLGVFLNISLPAIITKSYIGILITILGILMLLGITFKKTAKKLIFISGIGGFNKGFMGGGFGPVIVSGQIILDHDVRPSVAIGDIAEIPVCIMGLTAFFILGKLSFSPLFIFISIPALIASLIGPYVTLKVGQKNYAKKIIGIVTLGLGSLTLIKILLL